MSDTPREAVTVLVVDDTPDVRELMSLQLRSLGYRVVEAADGREAVEAARKSCPTLILMDVQMPVLDGLSAARLIRSVKELCRVIIVAFSAFGNGGNRERALDAGCDDYVSKAEGVTRLRDILRRHLPDC